MLVRLLVFVLAYLLIKVTVVSVLSAENKSWKHW